MKPDEVRAMNTVILAREKSERFPRKHLATIGGKTMIVGIVERCLTKGKVYLATGPQADNGFLGRAALAAGAWIYYEEDRPEWDIQSRVENCCKEYGIETMFIYSGDSPFTDMRYYDLLAEPPEPGYSHDGDLGANPGSVEGRGIGHLSLDYWKYQGAGLSLDDRRREQPGSATPDDPWQVAHTIKFPVPWVCSTQTGFKTSIDYPLEAAVADLIVRYLGRWPETDEEIERAYKEIKTI